MSTADVTAALTQALSERIGEERYGLWFRDKTKLSVDEGRLRVGVPNHFYQEWLEKTFGAELQAVADRLLGQGQPVAFALDPELFRAARQREAQAEPAIVAVARVGPTTAPAAPTAAAPTTGAAAATAARNTGASPKEHTAKTRPRRFRRLDDFVIGSCNRVAHAAAVSMVEGPEQIPSPLVLHGSVGIGKTHLLEGIYVGLRRSRPDWRVWFLPAEDFTNRFVQAIHTGKLSSFRKQFRECDALLIDDLHFLAKKPATQEEFLHTFDALHAEERPVIATCDCHPRLAEVFMPELTDRLVGGAVWGLATPERDTRLDLLRHKTLVPERPPLPADVLEFLADQLRGNIRELEGALHSVWHFARAHCRTIDLELAREALGDVLRHSVRLVQLADVEDAVCKTLGLDAGALQSKKRGWMISHPRMLAMFLARKHTAATYTEIGQRFGGRNHSTAVAGEKKVRAWLDENTNLQLGQRPIAVRDLLERIERELLK
jgi:chromosomal replication initiator protein